MRSAVIDEAISLYQSGMTLSEVGRELDIADVKISKMLKSAGVGRRQSGGGADRARRLAATRPLRPKYLNTKQWSDDWWRQQDERFLKMMRKWHPENETPPGRNGVYRMWRPKKSQVARLIAKRQDAPGPCKSSLEGVSF